MSYADGEYPTCTHEAHLTREVLDRWWARMAAEPREPSTGAPGTQAIALQIEDLCDADD